MTLEEYMKRRRFVEAIEIEEDEEEEGRPGKRVKPSSELGGRREREVLAISEKETI